MLGHDELLTEMRRLRDAGETSNAEIGRLLGLPSSRIAEIFATEGKTRRISLDEAKVLVDHFGLETPRQSAPSADALRQLLEAVVPLVPAGRATEQSLKALSEAIAYGLGLLGDLSTRSSPDALDVAARAAVARFREIGMQ